MSNIEELTAKRFAFLFLIPLLCCLPFLARAITVWLDYDDEGLFLQITQNYLRGVIPYREMPLEYGPGLVWTNGTILSILGVSHTASRVAAIALMLLTATSIGIVGFRFSSSLFIGGVAGALWLFSARHYYSESLHPGWYIVFILASHALVFHRLERCSSWVWLGIGTALVGLYKPHMALCSLTGLSLIALNGTRFGDTIRRVVSICFFGIWLLPILKVIQFHGAPLERWPSFIPGLISVGIVQWYGWARNDRSPRRSSDAVSLYWITTAVLLGVAYGVAAWSYGLTSIFEAMFQLPVERYPLLQGVLFPSVNGQLGLIFAVYLATTILPTLKEFRAIGAAFIASVALIWIVISPTLAFYAWPIIFLLSYQKIKLTSIGSGFLEQQRTTLLLLSCCHWLHTFPVAGAQVSYATPLAAILCVDLIQPIFQKFLPRKEGGGLLCSAALQIAICWMPFAIAYLRLTDDARQNVFGWPVPKTLAGMSYLRLENEVAPPLVSLVDYIRHESQESNYLLTFPGVWSLNLWSNRRAPGPFVVPCWVYLPEEMQRKVLPDLPNTPIVVIAKNNFRYLWESRWPLPETFSRIIYEEVIKEYVQVDEQVWNSSGVAAPYVVLRRRASE